MAFPPRTIPDYPEEILSLPMFHSDISCRQQAERYVLQHNQGEGSYIVRPNTDNDPSYVSITVSISGNKTCNAKVIIEKINTSTINYYIADKLKFPTLNALLTYYCEHRIHCKQGINVRLLRPLRKINQPLSKRSHSNSLGEASPSGSSLDEAVKGSKQTTKNDLANKKEKLKVRGNSESSMQASLPTAGLMKKLHEASLNNQQFNGHTSMGIRTPSWPQSLSEKQMGNPPLASGGNMPIRYLNVSDPKQDPKSYMKCRPPAPLPRPVLQPSDDTFYYSSVEANKDFFQEIYQLLKDSELCQCGLRLCDSDLAMGWTIHRSHDPSTLNHIFFQRDESTTWEMPAELVDKLTGHQIMFIIFLCREGKQPLPECLREMLDRKMGRKGMDI